VPEAENPNQKLAELFETKRVRGDWNLAPRDYTSDVGLPKTKQAAINSLATLSPLLSES